MRVQAREYAEALVTLDPSKEAAIISFADVVFSDENSPSDDFERIASLAGRIENDDAVSTVAFVYRARALVKLGLDDGALEVLKIAARRKKDRPADIVNMVEYERGEILARKGKAAEARKIFERIFATNPNYEDVREKLKSKL
ncbi:MAG: tetratricopeptide repeat protein [Parvularculaceae bacterium]